MENKQKKIKVLCWPQNMYLIFILKYIVVQKLRYREHFHSLGRNLKREVREVL